MYNKQQKEKLQMKKYLKYAGICSLVLAVVAFILMLATNAIVVGSGNLQLVYPGTTVIFGKHESGILGADYNPSPLALIAWILGLAGMVIVLLGIIMPLFKVKFFTKFAGLLNLIAVGCLVVAGIFMFIVVPTFFGNNGNGSVPNNAAIGAGWIIGAILYIVAGAVALLPAISDFMSKK